MCTHIHHCHFELRVILFDITDLIVWLFSSNRPAYTGEVIVLLAVVALLTLGRARLVFMRPREPHLKHFL